MSIQVQVLEEVGIGPNKNDPALREFKILITDPIVLQMLRNMNKNNDNATIQKLADMHGNDVSVFICVCGMDPQEFVDMVMEDPKMLEAVLIASRGKKQEEVCSQCREYDVTGRIFDGCYMVTGMEDLGCCGCASANGTECTK